MNKPLVCAFTAFFLLGSITASVAEEKNTGSFFSGLRKAKTNEKKPVKKKFPSIPTLFSKASKEPEGSETELTEEEKKLVKQASKTAGGRQSIPAGPVKMPPSWPKVEPRKVSWTVPAAPEVLRLPKDPNVQLRLRVPRPPVKYLQLETPQPPAKISGAVQAPEMPRKKR